MIVNFQLYAKKHNGWPVGSCKIDSNFIVGPIKIQLYTDNVDNPMLTKYIITINHNTPDTIGRDQLLNNKLIEFKATGYASGPCQHNELKSVIDFLDKIHRIEYGCLNEYDLWENIDLGMFTYVDEVKITKDTFKPTNQNTIKMSVQHGIDLLDEEFGRVSE